MVSKMFDKGAIKPSSRKSKDKRSAGERLKDRKKDLGIKCIWTTEYNPIPLKFENINGNIVLVSGAD